MVAASCRVSSLRESHASEAGAPGKEEANFGYVLEESLRERRNRRGGRSTCDETKIHAEDVEARNGCADAKESLKPTENEHAGTKRRVLQESLSSVNEEEMCLVGAHGK